jgi:site-specific DNA-methyltransferase (adenine-specific)
MGEIKINEIYNLDCLDGLKLLDDNLIDSIVTDPPYLLNFMNKEWDRNNISCNIQVWQECLRILKPGGYLLTFGGTRTYHRMACAIEDAGFEIRDTIAWMYGSGFPKSLDISKAIDKQAGVEREIVGNTGRDPNRLIKFKEQDGCKRNPTNEDITVPATLEAQQYQGWGTALKPAYEPIIMARKPLSEKTVASNVLKLGTGGINIDGCRIEVNPLIDDMLRETKRQKRNTNTWEDGSGFKNEKNNLTGVKPEGRFPANVILDEEAAKLLDEQSGTTKSARTNRGRGFSSQGSHEGWKRKSHDNPDYQNVLGGYNDSGGASRFFYTAKASSNERYFYCHECKEAFPKKQQDNHKHNYDNSKHIEFHPTVKPLSLLSYLVKLVTPPNGVCLDPFLGTGTTALACKNQGFNFIGFDNNEIYYNIALKRIS